MNLPTQRTAPFLLACLVLAGIGAPYSASAQTATASTTPADATSRPLAVQSASSSDAIRLTVGHSLILTSATPLRRVYVGNPAVLQTFTSGSSEVVLTAKTTGVSSMVLWNDDGASRLYTVSAELDPRALNAALQEAFPGLALRAEASDGGLVLTGSVATDAASDAAAKIAALYAKDVVNSIRVVPVHGRQVELKLRIVEVDRTRLDQLGINIFAGGRTQVSAGTEQYSSTSGTGSSLTVNDPLNLFLYNAKLNLGVTIKDLEEKQVLQVLAEPTLTTLSGLPARFLSGGEFPFPVVQGGTGSSTAVTIQFRPYGVKVEFTPTVNADGTIRLKLSPEVSTLDFSNAVTISGFTIPALSTRRAETEVEIQDGQSFIVSGLLDHRTTEILSKVPGIASVPILGELFHSKNFNHSVVELVIIVTATVVDPLAASAQTQPVEPKFAVPNLDAGSFDASAGGKSGASKTAQATPRQAAPQNRPELP